MEWTIDKIETARKMRRDGHTCREIGMAIGASRNAVIGKLHRLGIAKPSVADKWTPEQIATLKRMYADGATYADISKAIGFGVATCQQKASRIGLPSRGFVHYARTKSNNKPRGFRPKLVEGIEAPSLDLVAGILDVTGCKWPVGENAATPGRHLFCNHDVEGGGSYCPYHARIVFSKAAPVPLEKRAKIVTPTCLLRVA